MFWVQISFLFLSMLNHLLPQPCFLFPYPIPTLHPSVYTSWNFWPTVLRSDIFRWKLVVSDLLSWSSFLLTSPYLCIFFFFNNSYREKHRGDWLHVHSSTFQSCPPEQGPWKDSLEPPNSGMKHVGLAGVRCSTLSTTGRAARGSRVSSCLVVQYTPAWVRDKELGSSCMFLMRQIFRKITATIEL